MNPHRKYFKLKMVGSYAIVMFLLGTFVSTALTSTNGDGSAASPLSSLSPWIWGLICGTIGLVLAGIGPAISALRRASAGRENEL